MPRQSGTLEGWDHAGERQNAKGFNRCDCGSRVQTLPSWTLPARAEKERGNLFVQMALVFDSNRKPLIPCQPVRARVVNCMAWAKRLQKVAPYPSILGCRENGAVNATRYVIGDALKTLGLPVFFWSGAGGSRF